MSNPDFRAKLETNLLMVASSTLEAGKNTVESVAIVASLIEKLSTVNRQPSTVNRQLFFKKAP